MEQRWQDLASLLSLPSPDPAHAHAQSPTPASMAAHGGHGGAQGPLPHSPLHHPQALYPPHHHDASTTTPTAPTPAPIPRGVLLQNATLPPPMPDPMSHNITYSNSMGASSHLVASSMNLTNSSDLPGSEQAHHPHYKMENNTSLPPDMMYYQNTSSEINQTDGFLSSILNDEDLQLMDIAMNDYRNTGGEYQGGSGSYRYPIEDPHRHHPQKKHQMFGKRYFQDNNHGSPSGIGGGAGLGGFSGHYPHPSHHGAMEGATALDPAEMKYSCTMDFRAQGNELSGSVEHVQHNHTYHMSPEGPSGLSRPSARDKKSSKRSESDRSLTRDEKRARALNVPITCEDIINLPMDEFNERISKYDLTEPQLSLIRDIRRRGKNKVAAQNCRKRKLDQITHLAEEVKMIQSRKTELRNEYEYLTNERARVKNKFSLLYRHIFQSLRDPDGNPYSPTEYSLQQSADGNILLVPRTSNHTMDTTSGSKPRHHAKEGENQ
ncbi:segmentation protein cap'n'collar-like [Oratosquilla oratoria]|uniref:segmentation protein cap'n'collar-like n=1 Tax=Oratosquilla oratoria TaxID=337810 RepID=UPI003F775170